MIFKIDSIIADKYPDLRIGIICGKGVDNETIPVDLESLKIDSVSSLKESINMQSLGMDPHIVAWRQTYKSFGVKPKNYKPAAEALVGRILKGDNLPQISPIVDLYLVNELDNLLPIGGYDLDRVSEYISLQISNGDEEFLPIGASELEKTKKGEVIYRDASRILTRRWNYRDSDHAKITHKTQNFVLFIEAALPQITKSALEKATKELEQSLKRLKNTDIKAYFFEPAKDGLSILF